MNSTLQHMIDLLVELDSASTQLSFNLGIAVKKDSLNEEFLEDLKFEVHRLNMFAVAVKNAWGSYVQ